MARKGLILAVYRNSRSHANGGITAKADSVLVVGPGIPEIFEAGDGMPVVKLESHLRGLVRLVPGRHTSREGTPDVWWQLCRHFR